MDDKTEGQNGVIVQFYLAISYLPLLSQTLIQYNLILPLVTSPILRSHRNQ